MADNKDNTSVFPPESNRIKYIHRRFKRYERKLKRNKAKKFQKNWKVIEFPQRVNLVKHPNETLRYFNLAFKYYHKGVNVDYNLSNIVNFSPESIAVFSAYISSKNFTNNMSSRGNVPRNLIVSRIFKESGFFDHVNLLNESNRYKPNSSVQLLHKVTDNKVETDIAEDACIYAMAKMGFQYIDDLEPLYVILIEAMQNTNNHASPNEQLEYDWWLYRYEDKNNGLIHFTFLDIGVGVFKSLSVIDWKRKILEKMNLSSNLDLVDDLFAGRIKSRTLRKDRGKGIPQIYDASKDCIFEDFYIISNDVFINTKNDQRVKLNEELYGTLYYWTLKIK